jgi:hypothetical protein
VQNSYFVGTVILGHVQLALPSILFAQQPHLVGIPHDAECPPLYGISVLRFSVAVRGLSRLPYCEF